MRTYFDESLPALINTLSNELSGSVLSRGVAVRDMNGRLSYVLADDIPRQQLVELEGKVRAKLGVYAREDRLLVLPSDFGASELLSETSAVASRVGDLHIRVLDRRLVGADWLRAPVTRSGPPPRFVFASLKGGVGRSTALSVAASHLAARGKRVLAVDLDLEAPGLGSLLLNADTLPAFGLVDALVENGLAPLTPEFLADLVGPSTLSNRHGRIDVIPAFGSRSLKNPADVLAKLARAYVEDVREDGRVASIMDQVTELLRDFSDPKRYDAIFIDARAGLHETTATAILGLGAEVFLFGLDEPQTFQGYAALFAHLARFVSSVDASPEWLQRLTMIQGKAPISIEDRAGFSDACRQLFLDAGLEMQESPEQEPQPPAQPFSDVPWNDDLEDDAVLPKEPRAFRDPLAILDDPAYRHFNPHARNDLLTEGVYKRSYGMFLDRLNESFPEIPHIQHDNES